MAILERAKRRMEARATESAAISPQPRGGWRYIWRQFPRILDSAKGLYQRFHYSCLECDRQFACCGAGQSETSLEHSAVVPELAQMRARLTAAAVAGGRSGGDRPRRR